MGAGSLTSTPYRHIHYTPHNIGDTLQGRSQVANLQSGLLHPEGCPLGSANFPSWDLVVEGMIQYQWY